MQAFTTDCPAHSCGVIFGMLAMRRNAPALLDIEADDDPDLAVELRGRDQPVNTHLPGPAECADARAPSAEGGGASETRGAAQPQQLARTMSPRLNPPGVLSGIGSNSTPSSPSKWFGSQAGMSSGSSAKGIPPSAIDSIAFLNRASRPSFPPSLSAESMYSLPSPTSPRARMCRSSGPTASSFSTCNASSKSDDDIT